MLVRRAEAISSLQKRFPEVQLVTGDISIEADISRWISKALQTYGNIDCLINNAAVQGEAGLLHQVDYENFSQTIKTNFMGPVFAIQQVIPLFLKNKEGGVIINLSGGGATLPRPRFSSYATSKAALVRLTETLAQEYPELRFYAISPGGLRTSMTEAVVKMGADRVGQEYEQAKRRWEEGGEDPHRAAELAAWLFEEKPAALNGKLISSIYDNYREYDPKASPAEWWTLRRVDAVLQKKLQH